MSRKKSSHKKTLKKKDLDFKTAFKHPEIKPIELHPRKQNPIAFVFTLLFVVIFILGMILPSLVLFF